jgi:hypothetical protein
MRYSRMRRSASSRVAVGGRVTGSWIIPASERFTLRTMAAWASMERFLWMTPSPPSRAMAMAISASVTVSMAAERMGMLRKRRLVSRVLTETSLGRTSE